MSSGPASTGKGHWVGSRAAPPGKERPQLKATPVVTAFPFGPEADEG